MRSTTSDHVSMPAGWLWLIRIGCPVIAFGLAFAVDPLAEWALATFSSAPGPLRLAAEIPRPWLVPILTVVGVAVGVGVAAAERDASRSPSMRTAC